MSTFVLVHGAWHGAWCWYKVIPLLEKMGHKAVTFDLPSHGRDKILPENVTFRDYVDCLNNKLDAEKEPVILVGHSMSGSLISQCAEENPDKVKRLIYLSAFLLQDGENIQQLLGNKGLAKDAPFLIKEEFIKEALYADCSESDISLAKSLLTLEPNKPSHESIHISHERYGKIPRSYISCLKDHAIPVDLQQKMYSKMPCEPVIQMETSHSPFFSAPEQLVDHLISLIET